MVGRAGQRWCSDAVSFGMGLVFKRAFDEGRWQVGRAHLLVAALCDPDVGDLLRPQLDLDRLERTALAALERSPAIRLDPEQADPQTAIRFGRPAKRIVGRAVQRAGGERVTGLHLLQSVVEGAYDPLLPLLSWVPSVRQSLAFQLHDQRVLTELDALPIARPQAPPAPPRVAIVIYDDATTKMEQVIEILLDAGLGWIAAHRVMLTTHQRGRALFGDYEPSEADAVLARMRAEASRMGAPLRVGRSDQKG